ncbi:MAG: hypothetical protein PHD81_00290 [Candidatus Nanoarchaeia archaeon]|nr:hypothetical protein [Candidatus Nanoarchaeia archaeon]MDD5587530.1 hypothetical protein [Candidatus Nanoarchaeia archaeon]
MKKVLIILLVLSIFLVSGCVKTISEAKDDKYLNKTIKVIGQVNNKVGSVEESGFSLVDNDTYILVQSKFMPDKGSNITVKGILKKGKSGYWIATEEIYENDN